MLKKVFATVVTFNGGEGIRDTVLALHNVVDYIYIVDNCSDFETKKILLEFDGFETVGVCFLEDNVGIGAALNVALTKAKELGFEWFLSMDQDSVFRPGFLESFSDFVKNNPKALIMSPAINSNFSMKNEFRTVEYAITSGNLVHMSVFEKIGNYNEWFFIDGVDFEFSLRARQSGIDIYCIAGALLDHKLGDGTVKYFKRFHTYHSPLRRYYIFRNHFYLFKLFFKYYPFLLTKMSVSRFIYILTIVVFGKERFSSLGRIFLGVSHFFIGKVGKL
ncbi:glycosyltransferase [Pseudomonas chengduensis]|nr:glycosyltransferase [Pseudomonas chengduensis]MDH1213495.1 glycosyltransferase [Pseudomonas chengduensis]